MSKISLNGNALVITSALKAEDIKTAAKYQPKALSLFEKNDDGKLEETFTIGVGANGGINKYGVVFNGITRDGNGFATLTLMVDLPATETDAKNAIADKYGYAVSQLNKIEAALPAALKEIAEAKKAIVDGITVG